MSRIRSVLFDLNGTLLDPATIAPALPERLADRGGEVLGALDDAVLQAMALTLTGAHRPFSDLLRAALARRLAVAGEPGAAALEAAMERAAALRPFPEAAAALDRLAEAGLRLAVLTNSGTGSAEASLRSAGLRDRFANVIGADRVGAFKPDGRVYRRGLETVGCEPAEAVLVAAHWWDVLGAAAAGLRTAWVARKERVLIGTAPEPDVRGADLAAAADGVLALLASGRR